MIDKEKLLKEIKLKSDNVDVTWVYNFIKNFPEEPAQQIQKQREIPVKTIYTLKKEYQDVFKDFGFLHSTFDTHSYEPLPENIKKYYERTDEVDYSAIPKGSIVELKGGVIRTFLYTIDNKKFWKKDCDLCKTDEELSNIVRVVEWGNDAKNS